MRWSLVAGGAMVLVLALGCDPPGASTDVEPTKAEPTRAERRASFGACMAECAEANTLSATDRATCRLSCEEAQADDEVTPSAIGQALAGRYLGCAEGCPPQAPATDRATCMLNCAQQASSGDEASHWTAQQRGCAAACLEQVGSNLDACLPSGDDAETCRLQSRTTGERCVARCEVPGVKEAGASIPTLPVDPGVPAPPVLPVPPG